MSADTIHPLAHALIAESSARARVLVLGIGSGRHVDPLRAAGLRVIALDDSRARVAAARMRFADDANVVVREASYDDPLATDEIDGVLATHVYLHGDRATIDRRLHALARSLRPGTRAYFTLGSRDDPRSAAGRRVDAWTTAPEDGPEVGVPHGFFARADLAPLLRDFTIDSAEEGPAHPGAWAHGATEAATMRHWFVRAQVTGGQGSGRATFALTCTANSRTLNRKGTTNAASASFLPADCADRSPDRR